MTPPISAHGFWLFVAVLVIALACLLGLAHCVSTGIIQGPTELQT